VPLLSFLLSAALTWLLLVLLIPLLRRRLSWWAAC
jgi:hypothetical protein